MFLIVVFNDDNPAFLQLVENAWSLEQVFSNVIFDYTNDYMHISKT